MSPTIDAAIYVRISRDSEADGLGVKRQEKDCRQLAAQLGWDVVQVFTDNDVSATSRKPRPAYQRMMHAVQTRRIQAIVVWDVDRLTRRPRELEDWIDHADALGLKLASVGGAVELSDEQGRAMARMKGVFARLEAETIAKRQRAKQRELAEAGRYIGRRPFGYRFATDDDGRVLTGPHQRLVVDPDEASVIRECVRRVLAGEGLWSIMKDLNDRGITTSTGHQWQSQPLRRMLMRWTHAGYRKHQEYKNGKYVGEVTIHEAAWEAIIDRATHERVIAKLTDPRRVTNKGDTELKYLLTWLITCGVCERPMVGSKAYEYTVKGYKRKDGTRAPSRQRVYPAKYSCPHAGCHKVGRRMDVVDRVVEAHIVTLLEVEGVRVLGGNEEDAAEARERIEETKARMDLLGDRWTDGRITNAQFDRQNKRLMTTLKTEEAKLRAAMPAEDLGEFTGDGAAAAWQSADVVQKRAVVKALIDLGGLQIVVDQVGPGAFSAANADLAAGIRVEWPGQNRSDQRLPE